MWENNDEFIVIYVIKNQCSKKANLFCVPLYKTIIISLHFSSELYHCITYIGSNRFFFMSHYVFRQNVYTALNLVVLWTI